MSYWTRERVEALPPSVGTEVARELLARAEAAEAVIAEVRRWAQSGLAEVERLRALLRQGMDEQARRQTRVVAPGHTDLMVSPEAIDMYLAEERVDALDRLLHTMVDGACTECGLWEPMPYGLECPARLRAALDASPSQADVDELTETVTAEQRVADHYAHQRDEARAEVERLRVLLRRLQWGGGDYCPLCGGCRYAHHRGAADYGHAHDCEIAAALEVTDAE